MRWSIIRLIWHRELRDQLRDRRTVFMIAVLPVLLYPVIGLAVLQLAATLLTQPTVVGVVGARHLPTAGPYQTPGSPLPWLALLTATPHTGPGDVAAAATTAELAARGLGPGAPPLLGVDDADPSRLAFLANYFESDRDAALLRVRDLPWYPTDAPASPPPEALALLRPPRQVDLLLVVPPDFAACVARHERPALQVVSAGDERASLAELRLRSVLIRWRQRIKESALLHAGLSPDYDEAFAVDSTEARRGDVGRERGLAEVLLKMAPFLLVMWSLAGALYPAVDLCAGEKERGTMETLLISPARREEVVWGKFLTIWVFSAATALMNVASMGLSSWLFGGLLPGQGLRPEALFWCVVLLLPLSAFFSALCLSIGVYARSSKEGQYYLLPLFLATMPLTFLTLSPGVELNAFYSMVPVTGVALLLQGLMAGETPWNYFVPVLAPVLLYGWLALRWAIEQFNREDVLFREAERLDIGLWLRRLFREKEVTPSTGQALFCFALLLALRWVSFGLGDRLPLQVRLGASYLAFVAAPPLFMALMLTKRPLRGLLVRLPTAPASVAAGVLAVLLLPPLTGMQLFALERFPDLKQLLNDYRLAADDWRPLADEGPGGVYGLLALALLAAVSEELAFRGWLLTGLRRRFRPWPAIVVGSCLFALFQMNVYQLLPTFFLGLVLGALAVRTGSVLPGVVLHVLHHVLVAVLPTWLEQFGVVGGSSPMPWAAWLGVSAVGLALAAPILWRMSTFGYHRWVREEDDLVPARAGE